MPKSPGEMLEAMRINAEVKTGRTFEQWIALAKTSGLSKHMRIVNWLKSEHGCPHGYALWAAWGVTDPTRLSQYDAPDDLMDQLYSGKKAHLRPIHDRLIQAGLDLGGDVEMVACKTYGSLRNRAQFAMVNPRTLKAVDLELRLPPGTEAGGRLQAFKTSNPKFAHRIRISDPAEIDDEVLAVLRMAAEHVRG
jgi:hypothetical protein